MKPFAPSPRECVQWSLTLPLLLLFFLLTRETPGQDALDSSDKLYSAQFATYQRTQNGFLNDALAASKDALKTAENRYGPTHLSVVPLLTELATLYRIMGRFAEAESSLKWGLAIREKKLGPDHLLNAEILDHLASLYNDWGRWEEAEFLGKRALSLLEKKGTDKELIKTMALLGDIKLNLQQHSAAQSLLNRSLELQEKIAGPPPQTIFLLESQAQAYLAGNQPAKAESSLLKALFLTKKNFPADSIEVADATKKIADFYFATGQKEKSKPLFEAALKIDKGYVGVYYGYSALPYLHRLSEAYQSVGEYSSSKDLLEKALPTSRESFGPKHPLIAVTLLRLARAETALGDKKTAQTHRRESLEILESLFREDYPLILSVKSELGK